MNKISFSSFALILFLGGCILFSACECNSHKTTTRWTFDTSLQAWQTRETVWKQYRQRFHSHFQMIGLQSFDDGSHLLVISEPPPHVSQEALQDSFSLFNYKLEVKMDTVGEDGWVKDVVVAIAEAPLIEVRNLIRRLNALFHGSDYHADMFLPLPVEPRREHFMAGNLNYQISLPEIRKWFLDDKEPILTDNGSTYLAELLNQGATGVYFSKNPGFVVWLINRSDDLSKNKDHIRHFALDADLILGAVATNSHVAVIGRERANSVVDLPPLRTETVCMLAATDKSELAQSYERTTFLAGKLPDGKDWAPIYLSDELKNTEYGSLLNITDQMLKSWSCNGQIAYKRWKHPYPSHYAFEGNNGLMDEIKGSNGVTFNWNTKGATYSSRHGDLDIVALNRTGSLPVSYIPEGMEDSDAPGETVKQAEDKGYDYFSALNNPDLVRVVQYAFLYQIFENFDINSTEWNASGKRSIAGSPVKEAPRPGKRRRQNNTNAPTDSRFVENPLIESYTVALNKIANLDEQETERWSRQMAKDLESKLGGQGNGDQFMPDAFAHASALRTIARRAKSEGKLSDFVAVLASFREMQQQSEAFRPEAEAFARHAFALAQFDYAKYLGISIESVFNACKSAWAANESPWIKTPTVVLSWDISPQGVSIGGHNLGAHISSYTVDPNLRPGQIRVEKDPAGRRSFYVSKKDIEKVNPAMVQATKDAQPGVWSYVQKMFKSTRPRESVITIEQRPRGIENERIATNTFYVNGKECKNMPELHEALAEEARKAEGGLQYCFEKFSDNEVWAAFKTQQVRRAGKLSAKGVQEKVTSRHFDIENATVTPYRNEGKIVVEIPAQKNFFVRARVTISNLTRTMFNKAETIVSKALGRCKNDPMKDFEAEFFKEWEKERFQKAPLFRTEFFDVIFGRIEEFAPLRSPGLPVPERRKRLCRSSMKQSSHQSS